MNFSNTKAIISGGASGLGAATAKRIVQGGGQVAILDTHRENGEALAKELGDALRFYFTDITDEDSVEQAVSDAHQQFSGINLAVGCAGVLGAGKLISKKGPMPLDFFKKVVDINLIGSFLLTRAAAQYMAQSSSNDQEDNGVIIHTASIAAYEGQLGQLAYSATKAAIVGMLLPLARELAHSKIRVMGIAPGIFETAMVAGMPDKVRESLYASVPFPSRFGQPEEFAAMVEHIVSNAMLNGSVIRLDAAARLQ